MTEAHAAQIEYTIYTFEMPPTQQKRDVSWRKHATVSDIGNAMNEAKRLYNTQKFKKIEVKKKFFDQKKNRLVDLTLKVFEKGEGNDPFIRILQISATLMLIAGASWLAFS